MSEDLKNWQPRPRPGAHERSKAAIVRLEPLSAERHGDGLYEASSVADAGERFRWLPDVPPESRAAFQPWLDRVEASEDPLFFTVIDKASGKIAGRQTLMRIDAANGVIEIGNIYWGPLISRKPAATEAQFLFTQYAFDALGYRRYEWKCNNRNEPSKRAALTVRLSVRRRVPPEHGRQGRKPRHGVVLDHRQGMAGPETGLSGMARSG